MDHACDRKNAEVTLKTFVIFFKVVEVKMVHVSPSQELESVEMLLDRGRLDEARLERSGDGIASLVLEGVFPGSENGSPSIAALWREFELRDTALSALLQTGEARRDGEEPEHMATPAALH